MTQKKENEKRFRSSSTGQMCDCAQYIAELMCYRKASKDNVAGLEYKFWNKSRKQEFQSQVVAARRLINTFGEEAVLHYIHNDGKNLYSLGRFNSPKFILDGLRRTEEILAKRVYEVIEPVEEPITPSISKSKKSNGLLSKIKRAENKNG